MAAERAPVKEEPEWGARGESAAAAAEGLYAGHEVKEEVVLGPELIQMQDIAYLMQGALNNMDKDPFKLHACARPGERPCCNTSHQQQLQLSSCFVRLKRFPIEHLRRNLHTCENCLITFDCESSLRNHSCTNSAQKSNFNKVCDETAKIHLKCDICGKKYMYEKSLINHLAAHNVKNAKMAPKEEISHSNNVSQRPFKNQPALITPTSDRPGPRRCNICSKQFTLEQTLLRHMRTTHIDGSDETANKLRCDICSRWFPCLSHLNVHKRVHSGVKPFSCGICKKQFRYKYSLPRHMRIHMGEILYSCSICRKGFLRKIQLTYHLRTHTGEKPYHCDVCKKQFAQKIHLINHIRTHTGEKLYRCYICNKEFVEQSSLFTHIRIHTGEKPFTCDVCEKQFAQKAGLTSHRLVHAVERPYTCSICNKQFANKYYLPHHMRKHTKEKLYTCDICKKQFELKTHLTAHIMMHTGGSPYSCDVCQKQFSDSRDLTKHRWIHTGGSPYRCGVCNTQFSRNSGLTRHNKRVHKTEV